MSFIVYPVGETKDIYDELKSSFTEKNFVKINTFKENNCVYDSFLMATYRNYQDQKSADKCKLIRANFINQFKGFLISENTSVDHEVIYNKVFQAFEMSDFKENYYLKSLDEDDEYNILDLVIMKRDNQNEKNGFRLFSTKSKDFFKKNSNFFEKIGIAFLKEIIEQRIVKRIYSERLENEEANKEEITEILEFINRKENNLDVLNLFDIINIDECDDQDLVLKLLSEVLGLNIFLCRSWNSEISVIKTYERDDFNPYIIIFKIEGKVSYTGIEKSTIYETGGIKYEKGIKTILNPEKDKNAIQDMKKIFKNDIDSFYKDKYVKYLSNLEQKSKLDHLEDYYEDDVTSSSEDEDEDEDEAILNEDDLTSSSEDEAILNEDGEEIPQFIKDYSKLELEDLMNMFVNPDYDYSPISKKSLEIQYNSYLKSDDS
tara:strand:+ start:937 stop:2229 length:1293 start_codon:yes stop_codon:yes gene_type:complete